jgi:prolyl-tRNA editing enzyme YbaK/EbsC (Cys-tRNA(Pro) deacylase)
VSRFDDAVAALGLEIETRRFPEGTRTAVDAARAVGVEVGQIVKSLVFRRGDEPLLVLASGPNRVDEDALGVERADAAFVREVTGYAIGGVPPFGHATSMETVIDEDLLQYEEVWAAAGRPDTNFAIAPAALVEVTGGRVTRVTAE